MDLKRDEIKYVRDISKSAYKKANACYICDADEDLQFHHFYTMTLLWAKWKRSSNIVINSVDDILEHRDTFKEDHHDEIYNKTITLCKSCHMGRLHKVYGKTPTLITAEKQVRWCDKQKQKHQEKLENGNTIKK